MAELMEKIMSLESIIGEILDKADKEKGEIIRKAEEGKDKMLREAEEEAKGLYEISMKEQKVLYENQKQKRIVSARLEAKRNQLKTKQELINQVLDKVKGYLDKGALKKEQVKKDGVEQVAEKADFYLDKVRFDCETGIAKILFEK
jgi:V/A-type H+-transporting ATPase subunit E